MNDLSTNELELLRAALDAYTPLSDDRNMLHAGLLARIESELMHREELTNFADECAGGACKL
jgi:hypothetical protein